MLPTIWVTCFRFLHLKPRPCDVQVIEEVHTEVPTKPTAAWAKTKAKTVTLVGGSEWDMVYMYACVYIYIYTYTLLTGTL